MICQVFELDHGGIVVSAVEERALARSSLDVLLRFREGALPRHGDLQRTMKSFRKRCISSFFLRREWFARKVD